MLSWQLNSEGYIREIRVGFDGSEFLLTYVFTHPDMLTSERKVSPEAFFDPGKAWHYLDVRNWDNMSPVQTIFIEAAHALPAASLPGRAGKQLAFWRACQPDRPAAFALTSGKRRLEVGPHGAAWYYLLADGTKNHTGKATIAELWLNGPEHPVADPADRQQIRAQIFAALDSKSGLSLDDAFPMIDYGRVPEKRWEYNVQKGSGEFVEMKGNEIHIGGWSPPDQGGSNQVTYEQFLTFLARNSGIPEAIKKEINHRLSQAVLPAIEIPKAEPKFVAIGDCPVCRHIGETEHAFSKYGHEDEGPPWPKAANKLQSVPGTVEAYPGHDLKQCPVCKTYYAYRHTSEYFTNGSEDSVELTRLTMVQVRSLLPKKTFAARMKQLESELHADDTATRRYASKSLCDGALESANEKMLEKLLSHKDEAVLGATIDRLQLFLSGGKHQPQRDRARLLAPYRPYLWRAATVENAAGKAAFELLRTMESKLDWN